MGLAPYVPGELIPLPLSGSIPELPHVAKVENRTTLKISRKSIFGLLCCCVAFQRRYGGSWSILDETIWSLTSPRVNIAIKRHARRRIRPYPPPVYVRPRPSRQDVGARTNLVAGAIKVLNNGFA